MHPAFAAAVETLHPSFERLMSMRPIKWADMPSSARTPGVYLFSEGDTHLYVGRSNDVRARYGRHCRPGATHRMAAFAFRLARETTGKTKASYKAGADSRSGLILDAKFAEAFEAAKARVRAMDFRFVKEADPTRQALLEMYCSVALDTRYNDFDTH